MSDGSCPENTVPCSDSTSAENTVCYSTEDKEAKLCPIKELKLMEKAQADGLVKEDYEKNEIQG